MNTPCYSISAALAKSRGATNFMSEMKQSLSRFVEPPYRDHPAYVPSRWNPFLTLKSLARISPFLLRNFIELKRRRGHWAALHRDPNRLPLPDYQDFFRQGFLAKKIDAEKKRRLVALAKPHFDELREKRAKDTRPTNKINNLKLRRNLSPELFALVDEILTEHRVLQILSAYNGYPMGISTVNTQINDASDLYWTNHFSDVNLPDPPTSYMHIDSSVSYIKAIIYLNEVSETNGSFCYVRGSNLVMKRKGFWDFIIRKANDMSRLDRTDPRNRELFRALPSFFRRKSEMGNDYKPGDDFTHELLRNEVKFTSDRGDMIVFDTDGIHRGAMVQTGERLILQVAMTPLEHIRPE